MTPLLTTWLDFEGDTAVVRVVGELDTATVRSFSDTLELAAAMLTPPRTLQVDLSEVTFFGSAGMAVLTEAHDRFERWGIALRVTEVSAIVARVFAVTSLDRLVRHVED